MVKITAMVYFYIVTLLVYCSVIKIGEDAPGKQYRIIKNWIITVVI
jgi:hypothetical protein